MHSIHYMALHNFCLFGTIKKHHKLNFPSYFIKTVLAIYNKHDFLALMNAEETSISFSPIEPYNILHIKDYHLSSAYPCKTHMLPFHWPPSDKYSLSITDCKAMQQPQVDPG